MCWMCDHVHAIKIKYVTEKIGGCCLCCLSIYQSGGKMLKSGKNIKNGCLVLYVHEITGIPAGDSLFTQLCVSSSCGSHQSVVSGMTLLPLGSGLFDKFLVSVLLPLQNLLSFE